MTAALPIDSEPFGVEKTPEPGAPTRLAEQLAREYRNAILAVCLAHTHDHHDAEDCVQETLLKLLDKVGELRDLAHARAWLCQIARRVCIDRARRQTPMQPLADTAAACPPAQTTAPERAARLHAALARLPAEYREVLALYYLDGRDSAQVAAALELTPAAVRQRLVRGRLKLHDLLTEDSS